MITVIRPTWTPTTPEQKRLVDAAVRAARKATELKRRAAEAEEHAWQAILDARADVPDLALCGKTGFSRATLNRRYGSRNAIRWLGDNFAEIKEIRPDARLATRDHGDIRKGDLLVDHLDGSGPVVVGLHQVVRKRDDSASEEPAPARESGRRPPTVAPVEVEESVDELVSEPFRDPA